MVATTSPQQPGRTAAVPDTRRALVLLGLIAVLAAAISLFVVSTSYLVDDSFIYYRYARNLLDGHGVVYNPGVRVEGYTSFSHIVLPWLALALRADPLHFMQGLGLFAQSIALWLTWRIGVRVGRSPLQALVAPLLLATNIIPLSFAMSGMPIALYYAMVTGAAHLIQGGLDTRRSQVLLGIVLAAITLTRFDGFVLAGVLLGFVVLIDRRLLSVWPTLAILGGVMLVYNLWRITYYPTPLPNTYYAKMGFSLRRAGIGWVYLSKFLDAGGQYLLILGAAPFALRRAGRRVCLLGWVSLAQLCYVTIIGGDWMDYSRFVLPVLPLIAVLAQEGLWTLLGAAHPLLRPQILHRTAAALALLLLLTANAAPLNTAMQRFPAAPWNERIVLSLNGRYWSRPDGITIAQHIDRNFPADWKIALEWAGLLPYHFHQPVVDMFGLNDPRATQMGFPTSDHGLNIPAKYITDQRPAVIVVVARLYDTPQRARQAIAQRMNERRGPQWVHDLYNPLDKPPHDYKVAVEQVGGRYWAMLLRPDLQLPRRGQ